ncbi:D-3-phosphoglycerate dehydrogenase [Klebsiella pneumoniae]|uniref:D-3-phosphoglycerate dehydrogenase n=1 Tax=Klebsiella pneumoniae TaxID=573 RepID=A0A378F8B9_KLEPN|nr:D-3-phosphoglycerate dehydrogenase [Klebsiella pneumoniae]
MDFYLGIDIGTSRVKAVLFDQHFTACASAAEKHLTPPVGQWLRGTGYDPAVAFGAGYSAPDCPPPGAPGGAAAGYRLAGQGEGVWLSDEQGEPVGPGILWSDTRSHELMSDLLRRPGFDRRYFADTGTHLQPCNTSLQLYWLKQYQPARLAVARYLFFAKDWIRFRLTGVAALELTDASSSLLNQQTGSWSSVVMNEMGLNELLPLFPPLLAPDAPAGTLSDAVAALTGLPAATPVAAGALDVCSAALGCGAVNEGDIYTILGTTCCTGIVCRGRRR